MQGRTDPAVPQALVASVMLADVLLSPLHNEVVTVALGTGESERVAAAVRGLITVLLDAPPGGR